MVHFVNMIKHTCFWPCWYFYRQCRADCLLHALRRWARAVLLAEGCCRQAEETQLKKSAASEARSW